MTSRRLATPCNNPAGSGLAYGWSFESCATQCTTACAKSSACTTAVVKDKVGNGRECSGGQLGQDELGACVPAFGAVKDAWANFSAHCTTCGDSEACQAACATVMTEAPLVVDESKAHPDVCPSFDCPDCVGSCTSCTPAACVRWCDARHTPGLYCSGNTATSVQGTFQEHSLQTRTTPVEKAMGNFYDARCKVDGVRRSQAYLGAFDQGGPDAGLAFGPGLAPGLAPGLVPGLPSGSEADHMRAYVNDRVRRSEERRYRQLEALGVGQSLRRPVPMSAPVPKAVPRAVRSVMEPAGGEVFNAAPHARVSLAERAPYPTPCSIDPAAPNCSALPSGLVEQVGRQTGSGGPDDGLPADRSGTRGLCPAGTWRPKPRACHTVNGKTLCTIRKQ